MAFLSNTTPDTGRQMFCQLYDGFSMKKKTNGYRQKIRNTRMTICGSSTGVLLPPVLQEFLKHVMTDGVVVRCLFMVLGYHQYLRKQHTQRDPTIPTIAQLMLAVVVLGQHKYVYSDVAQTTLDKYIEELSVQTNNATSPRIASFLAKQATHVIRISALTQIIDLLPTIIERVNMYVLALYDFN